MYVCVTNMPLLFTGKLKRRKLSNVPEVSGTSFMEGLLLFSKLIAYYIYLQQPAKPQCWRWVIWGHFTSFKSLPVLLLYGTFGLPLVFNPVHNIQAVPASKARLTASIIFTIFQRLPKSGLWLNSELLTVPQFKGRLASITDCSKTSKICILLAYVSMCTISWHYV